MPMFTIRVFQTRRTATRLSDLCFNAKNSVAAQREAIDKTTKDRRSKWENTKVIFCIPGINKITHIEPEA